MKRSRLIILVILAIVICSIGYLIAGTFNKPAQNLPDTGQREAELGGPKTVNLTNVAELSDILLPNQMQVVRAQISTFLLDYYDPNTIAVAVEGTPTVNSNGLVVFTIKSKAPEGKRYSFEQSIPNSDYSTGQIVNGTSKATSVFTIIINRDSNASITMTVKEFNYITVDPL